MPLEMTEEGRLLIATLSGVMRRADSDAIRKRAAQLIHKHGRIRALIVGSDFGGWERSEKWADFELVAERDRYFEKIAVVADQKWKDEVLMFMAKPFREVSIEFFPTEQLAQARKWVDG
jgi:hypothetical protein